MKLFKAGLLLAFLASALAAANKLDVYTIDVEGGKSVLFVSPSGESLLIDAGWPAAGQWRVSTGVIVDAVKAAGLKRIDHLLISHFDIDHIGDVPALEAKVPIGHIYDHGDMQFPAPAPNQKAQKSQKVLQGTGSARPVCSLRCGSPEGGPHGSQAGRQDSIQGSGCASGGGSGEIHRQAAQGCGRAQSALRDLSPAGL